MIDFILGFIGTLISYLNVSIIYSYVTNKKFKIKWSYALFVLFATLINTFLIFKLPVYIKSIFNLSCFGISNKILYNDDYKSCIFYIIFIWIIGVLLDIVSMIVSSFIFNVRIQMLSIYVVTIFSISVQVIYNLIFRFKFLSKFINKIKKFVENLDNLIIIYFLIILFIVVLGSFCFLNLNNVKVELIISLSIFMLLSLTYFFIYSYSSKKTYQITIENLIFNNNYYVELNNNYQEFRHNIFHKLNGIKSVASSEVCGLINEIVNEYSMNSNDKQEIPVLPNGINGLIYQKVYSVSDKIKLVINNYLTSELLDVTSYKSFNALFECLGVCLDNAISATLKSQDKILHILIFEEEKFIKLRIVNTFDNSVEIDKIGLFGYTNKNNGHGFGLHSLLRKRYIDLKINVINNLFESEIVVKKSNKKIS